ncbi:uncharacterized protein LOC128091404 [Tympanuchus pallidicinctus]|uniref:uncharacterized protein LOC122179188 n=1 Tax=Lagopus leucura TaxID=30410 RepID=UPI001C663650|nr:uncharacterized protein LOC122179188 [Lagopus leucura]XP_052560462.1 uncharacterized protein LOC128091404 [Tympanuchus pallidicinctus]
MAHQDNLGHSRVHVEENDAAGNQGQQGARPRQTRFPRRKCKQLHSARPGGEETRVLQVYKFMSRPPAISVHSTGEEALGLSSIPVPRNSGRTVKTLARSASPWVRLEPVPCWVKDCTGLACSADHGPRRHLIKANLQAEKDSLRSVLREELFSRDEDYDDLGTASSQAGVVSSDAPRSLAEEFSLVPLNMQRKYSALNFDLLVERCFKRL